MAKIRKDALAAMPRDEDDDENHARDLGDALDAADAAIYKARHALRLLHAENEALRWDLGYAEDRAHSDRFRKVANRYALRVEEAYAGDTAAAMADSDQDVAIKVAKWESEQGLEPRDWGAIGREEGRP